MPFYRIAALALAVSVACGKKSTPVEPQTHDGLEERFQEIKSRLLSVSLEGGWVATRAGDGTALDLGDSLLWTGVALGVLPCDDGKPVLDALKASQDLRNGYFVRYEPLSQKYTGNEVSRDGVTGLAFGLVRRAAKCPEDKELVSGMWRRFRDLTRGAVSLYPGDLHALQSPEWAGFVAHVDHVLLDAAPVPYAKVFVYQQGSTDTVGSIVKSKGACYPVHLATLQNYLMDSALDGSYRAQFCQLTKESGLELTAWYCGAGQAQVHSWLEQYTQDQVGYAHQRCVWETEDFSGGKKSPSLDWLILFTLAKEGLNHDGRY